VASFAERTQKRGQLLSQGSLGRIVVVEMKLYFAESTAYERFQPIEEPGTKLLARKEERVLRATTVRIPERGRQIGIPLLPSTDSLLADILARVAPKRLVVIAKRKEKVLEAPHLRPAAFHPLANVTAEPPVQVLLSQTIQHGWEV